MVCGGEEDMGARRIWGRHRGKSRCFGIVVADGDVELSLTVPITNSLAFFFTVLGEWWADGKVISRGWCFFSFDYVGY